MIQVLGLPLLMCFSIVAIMSYLGIHVLKREIIFVDIALAQLAALGAIAAHLAFHAHHGSVLSFLVAFAFVLVAAGFYAFARRKATQIPIEAVIGVSYAIAAAGALFLVGVAPGGHVHVQHMLAGSILWVTCRDVLVCAAAFVAVGGLFVVFRGPLTSISEDYEGAISRGANVVLWDFVFYALCGFVITFVVRVSGIVLVFAFLIIPATVSALFGTGWRLRLVVAWAAGAAASILGLLFAYRLDFSMGPSVAMFLGVELALAGIYSVWRSRTYVFGAAGCLALVFAGLLLAGPAARSRPEARAAGETVAPDAHETHEHAPGPAAEDFGLLVARADSGDALARLFTEAPDEAAHSDVIVRALHVDRRTGVRLMLAFLRTDPPLFFRQVVVDKLEEVSREPTGFDVGQPSSATVNRAVAGKIAEEYGP